jgi:transposase-like protein
MTRRTLDNSDARAPARRTQTRSTPEVMGRIVDALRRGATVEAACSAGPIARSTYYEWRRYGERDLIVNPGCETPFVRFAREVDEAQGAAELALSNVVFDAAKAGDWKAALAVLERRWPTRWQSATVVQIGEPTFLDDESRAEAILDGMESFLAARARTDAIEVGQSDGS